jgi:hypothetical protein
MYLCAVARKGSSHIDGVPQTVTVEFYKNAHNDLYTEILTQFNEVTHKCTRRSVQDHWMLGACVNNVDFLEQLGFRVVTDSSNPRAQKLLEAIRLHKFLRTTDYSTVLL